MTQDNDSAYRAEYDRHWNQAVKTLAAAARLEHPRHGTVDFGDFLATALRATAANLGDPHALTAGRPVHGNPRPSANSSTDPSD